MRALLAFAVLGALLVAGCSSAPTATTNKDAPKGTAYGVSLSPRSFQGSDFSGFFDEAKAVGSVVLWGGAPEAFTDPASAAYVTASLAHQKGLQFAAQVSYVGEKGEKAFSDLDQTRWRSELLAFVQKTKPEWLGLGVEVDRFVATHGPFFAQYSTWFNVTIDEVHKISPTTRVFVSYQYEHLQGMTGGLYGGPERSNDSWSTLALFAKADVVAFTTYPGLVLQDAGAIPDAYYAAIRQHTSKPVAFSEAGHFAALDKAPGWESTPAEQAAFATRFMLDAKPLAPALVVWLHLHDQANAPRPFQQMGLLDGNGAKRPAYDAWVSGR